MTIKFIALKKSLKTSILILSAVTLPIIPSTGSVLAVDEQFYNSNNILFYNPQGECNPAVLEPGSNQAPKGKVVIGQANIQVAASDAVFNNQLDKVINTNPDFITGNEWSSRTNNTIKRDGYDFYRGVNGGNPERKSEGNVVMWKSDRWGRVNSGTIKMTLPVDKDYTSNNKPAENWDDKRSMAWVTLQDNNRNRISVATIHHMVNPNRFGPKEARKELYKKGMERAVEKIKELQSIGPVIIAGDFNAQKSDDGLWHPRTILKGIDIESTHDSLPKVDSYIDWIFYTKKDIKAIDHAVPFNLVDHPYIKATLEFKDGSQYKQPAPADDCCIVDTPASDSSNIDGDSNAEKLFKFLVGKGLTATQAAGIIGNVMQESGGGTFNINPDSLNKDSGAFGIVQWTSTRKTRLIQYAKDNNKPENDLGIQMDFLWKELNEGYKNSVLSPIKATNDLKEVTRIFLERFEIPCLPGSSECAAEMDKRMPYSEKAFEAFSGLAPDNPISPNQCGNNGGGEVNPDGFAFPIGLPKKSVDYLPCNKTTCHHDGTPASDMFAPVGTPVYAIEAGVVSYVKDGYDDISGCYSIGFNGDSGWKYWYGHIKSPNVSDRERVRAGDTLALVGESKCAKGTSPHLHIDRGSPKGRTGGEDCCRDPDFVPLLNNIFNTMNG